ncbi:hypothetical protein CHS0354_024461 [Potamilus streckersoni]|uniref:Uncharacterized protein n=1 Tax=Potamilus streckersoni TaxID=2493646 RepID=A0AAE0TLM1_9BIVA|nr:hypothetical protein CHS0354_024461 [Potamilus streckersoni]
MDVAEDINEGNADRKWAGKDYAEFPLGHLKGIPSVRMDEDVHSTSVNLPVIGALPPFVPAPTHATFTLGKEISYIVMFAGVIIKAIETRLLEKKSFRGWGILFSGV